MTMPSTSPATGSKRNLTPIIVPIITLVVGAGLGYGWSMRAPAGTTAGVAGMTSKETRACYDEVTKKLELAGILQPEREMRSMGGEVKSVSGNTVMLTVSNLSRSPLADPTPEVRTVTVPADLKITLRKDRDEMEFYKEQQAFQEARFKRAENPEDEAEGVQLTPPMPFTETTITMADVKPGMRVTVSAETDIFRAESFTATTFAAMEQVVRGEGGPDGGRPPRELPPDGI